MKVYSILVEKNVDEENENFILDNISYGNEADAWKRMLNECQVTKDDWNRSDDHFEMEVFASVRSCSITSQGNPDYMNFTIIETEVK